MLYFQALKPMNDKDYNWIITYESLRSLRVISIEHLHCFQILATFHVPLVKQSSLISEAIHWCGLNKLNGNLEQET
jgi:hypothetical protein